MSDYIKREDMHKKIDDEVPMSAWRIFLKGLLNDVPSADVVEVKHGHWLFGSQVDGIGEHGADCSVCGEYSEDNGEYCTWCGAKMDDELQKAHERERKDGENE